MRRLTTLLAAAAVTLAGNAVAGSTGSGEPTQGQVDSMAGELYKAFSKVATEGKRADSSAVKMLAFRTRVVKAYANGMMKVGVLVTVLNTGSRGLEVCVDFLDKDGFAVDRLCRTTRWSPEGFTQHGDTTTFRCTRVLVDGEACVDAEARVWEVKP